MTLTNNYPRAVEVTDGLFAVELQSGGWSIADGPGTMLCRADERELAGWHVPVRFDSEAAAVAAIRTGPHEMFDIAPESVWSRHCIASGAAELPECAVRLASRET